MSWIRFACELNGVPELIPSINVEWSQRFTRRMGDALYSPVTFRARIRLSIPLWPRASEQDRRETAIHEACHIVVKYKFGSSVKDHGAEWKTAMENCGVEPLRNHNVDRTGLVRCQRLFVLKDRPNEHQCRMSVREYNQVQRGAVMACKKCGLLVNGQSPVEEDWETTLQKL